MAGGGTHIESDGVATAATVLLVDDDPLQLERSRQYLELGGYQVRTAAGVIEAFDAVRRQPPDVVVSDVLLGDLDGFTLCRMIRSEAALARLPVVLISERFQ